MADNAIATNGGSPVTFGTDDIGGVNYPRVKLGFGVDGAYADVSATDPLPMTSPAAKAEDSPHVSGDTGMFVLAIREDSDIPTANNGDYTALKLDEVGRLKVSTQPASYADGTGNITANGQTVFLNVDRASNVTISMVATTLVGHNATFEYSNNSTNGTDGTWYGVQVARSNANTADTTTGVLAATPAYGWELSVNAYKWIRVRATAHTSGTAAYIIKQGTYATEPVPIIQVTGTQPVSGTVTVNGTVAVSTAAFAIPATVGDVASAAITTTTTTAAFIPTVGVSYSIFIPVTVVSGTTPTLDVMVQESDDGGTNWFDVYQFPRITATGAYRSPVLNLMGNRVRYVQTISGTTPSFTRAISRFQRQEVATKCAQLFDRTISLTTINAVTASLNTMGVENAELVINIGTATTPPALQLEGSDDNANWYALGSPLTAVASSTVKVTVPDVRPSFIRARVSTVGATVVSGYVLIKGF